MHEPVTKPQLDPHEREALLRRVTHLEAQLLDLRYKGGSPSYRARTSLVLTEELRLALLALGDSIEQGEA